MSTNASIPSYLGLPFGSSDVSPRHEQKRPVVDAPYPESSPG